MGKMKETPRYNVISMRISDEEERFFKSLVASGQFLDKTAALRHFVEAGVKVMERGKDNDNKTNTIQSKGV
jgi:hypothetical protein